MASACVNNSAPLPSLGWLNPDPKPDPPVDPPPPSSDPKESDPDPCADNGPDFEFRLHDPVAMLTADELFSNGKLVPLQMTSSRAASDPKPADSSRSTLRSVIELSDPPASSSPKAPKCSSRWREILGFKKSPQQSPKSEAKNPNHRSIKSLLHRNPNTRSLSSSLSLEPSMNLPLLRDSDSESLSLSSSRISLSSTSSSSDSCDLPRLSLDSDKPGRPGLNRAVGPNRARARPVRRAVADAESPRMNSSGKVVFYSGSLERSSSSPGSFNGGPVRPRGMERSFSANVVRVSPVLNVPVCSLRGSTKPGSVFGFFSGQRKEKDGPSTSTGKSTGKR